MFQEICIEFLFTLELALLNTVVIAIGFFAA